MLSGQGLTEMHDSDSPFEGALAHTLERFDLSKEAALPRAILPQWLDLPPQ